ncbi:hypothetical protein IFM89_035324 [Coptis chinensis]|uniref:Uncharacterized protein n=1 Tax=Coptis chinensis TaxID=261450 RepID=A0A835IIT2_9MAGN|nr:hypothetical protein IFM89_035324 [Coptis chinensis]
MACMLHIQNYVYLVLLQGPVTGYRSVLRTLVSSFIACYDITQQLDDGTLSLILNIICKIYRMEESLCSLFWDRDSSVDGPIRCLLDTFEVEFPFRNMELVRLLSALCVRTWPAECLNISQTIVTQALHVPEVEDLLIPSQTRGHVVKVCGRSTVLVRWEYRQSEVFVLLLRLARDLYLNHYEETHLILDLLCRLVSSNKIFCAVGGQLEDEVLLMALSCYCGAVLAVCAALMDFDNSFSVHTARLNGHVEKRNMHPQWCISPSHVSEVVLKQNIFDLGEKKHDIDVYPNESVFSLPLVVCGCFQVDLQECSQLTVNRLKTAAH